MGNLFASPTSAKENLEQLSDPNDNKAEPAIQKEEIPLIDIRFSGSDKAKTIPIANPANCFSVLSYNILAEVYSRFLSKDVAEKFLDISYRSAKIIEELKRISSDIICLQEVDNYTRIYKPYLQDMGYEAMFVQRFNMRGDGCVIGAKKDKFELIEQKVLDLDKGHDYEGVYEFQRGNIAIIATLRHKASNMIVKVVCSHLYWDPKFEHVKYLQMSQVVQYVTNVNQTCKKQERVIWAGDFNSKPRSNLVRYIVEGKLPKQKKMEFKDPENLKVMKEISEKLGKISQKLKWKSVYENYGASLGDEKLTYPEFTNYTGKFREVIDYIFYVNEGLVPRQLLKLPASTDIKNKTLPNRDFPSDHLPIIAVFELI